MRRGKDRGLPLRIDRPPPLTPLEFHARPLDYPSDSLERNERREAQREDHMRSMAPSPDPLDSHSDGETRIMELMQAAAASADA